MSAPVPIQRTDFEALTLMERSVVATMVSMADNVMETLLDAVPLTPGDLQEEPTRKLLAWLMGERASGHSLSLSRLLLDLERTQPDLFRHAKTLLDGYVQTDFDSLVTYAQAIQNEGTIRAIRSDVPTLLASSNDALRVRDAVFEYLEARTNPFEASRVPVAHVSSVVDSVIAHLDSTDPVNIYDFGISDAFQENLVDFSPGNMGLLGGTPGTGKTSLIVQSIVKNAHDGRRVGFITLEMTALQLTSRLLSRMTGVSGSDILRKRNITPQRRQLLLRAKQQLDTMPFFMNNEHDATLDRVLSLMRQMVRKHGVEVIYLDYVQRLSVPQAKGDMRIGMTMAADELARFASKHGVALMVASQLKRLQGREPALDDFRESGALEANAAFAMTLYWDKDLTRKVFAEIAAQLEQETEGLSAADKLRADEKFPERILKADMLKQRNDTVFSQYLLFKPAQMTMSPFDEAQLSLLGDLKLKRR
jgi:replicative DNA helicase